ncbi:hypothetical protein OKA05_08090 [Luteolibacter arcticus]|uniref:Lipoprotein n=1 Tax=Luteolibacter arcticus TaxID=1581411 RepID=A0ABT3GFW7_9BACT|nr:hypothetical protein [Luteolibacter arcticus]MCW1922511.1 hypothetical protein [Luteolibacter arcticus]
MNRLLAGTSAAFVLVACDDQDGGLQERVALLQAELDQKAIDIEKSRKALAAAEKKEQATTAAPDLDAAKSSYLSGVDDFGKSLAESLPGVKFERTSVFPVEGPDSETPIRSKVAYQVTLAGGKTAEITVPLVATAKGDWRFPKAPEIANQFKSDIASMASRAAAAPLAATRPTAPAQPQARPAPTDVLNADRTVQVEWNDPASPAPRQASPPAQPPPQAQAPAQPPATGAGSPPPPELKKVMPSSRDVIIDFED